MTKHLPELPPPKGEYRVCTRCVMDTTTPSITFGPFGFCCFCTDALERRKVARERGEGDVTVFDATVSRIRRAGVGARYDCLLGISGGVDSSYTALLLRQLGLRTLLVQFDNGWNSEIAVANIQQVSDRLGFDLVTHVVAWEEFRRLQVAFFRAHVVDLEAPTDHGIIATLYHTARRFGVHTIISGVNRATESVIVRDYGYNRMDLRYLEAVNRRHGGARLTTFPRLSFAQQLWYRHFSSIESVPLLDLLPGGYNKSDATRAISDELGWRDYGGKHHESHFTKFLQIYYLPRKCGLDKRRAHLSSLVLAGQMTRADALLVLDGPIAPAEEVEAAKQYVMKKLRIPAEEFEALMSHSVRPHTDLPNNEWAFNLYQRLHILSAPWLRRIKEYLRGKAALPAGDSNG